MDEVLRKLPGGSIAVIIAGQGEGMVSVFPFPAEAEIQISADTGDVRVGSNTFFPRHVVVAIVAVDDLLRVAPPAPAAGLSPRAPHAQARTSPLEVRPSTDPNVTMRIE